MTLDGENVLLNIGPPYLTVTELTTWLSARVYFTYLSLSKQGDIISKYITINDEWMDIYCLGSVDNKFSFHQLLHIH
jgi:hypothetical protein